MSIYCTYITTYSGDKMPPFYIGSTSKKKIDNGYYGSICSKEYKEIWKNELKFSPHLFTTQILELFETRIEAYTHERQLHIEHDVVKSELYINKTIALSHEKFGGSGENNHMYGKKHRPESIEQMIINRSGNKHSMYGKKHRPESIKNMSLSHIGSVQSAETRSKRSKSLSGMNAGSAKIIIIIKPDGEIVESHGNFIETCESLGLPLTTMRRIKDKGLIPLTGKCIGYQVYDKPN
jgi:hypothetical protein